MYKRVKKYRLQGKTASHKNLLIRSLVSELVRAEKIKTTGAKARILKSQFDRLVTAAKRNNDASKRTIDSFFASNEKAVTKFYKLISEKLQDRNSGYTRLFKTLPRKGDNADQVFVMLVNYEQKEKKSNVEKLLEKRKKTSEEKSVAGRVKKALTGKAKAEK